MPLSTFNNGETNSSVRTKINAAISQVNILSGYLLKTANYTAVAGDQIAALTTGGAFTITLPATPADGDTVEIVPARGTFGANSLTVERNGQNIDGAATNLVLSSTLSGQFIFSSGYGWRSFIGATSLKGTGNRLTEVGTSGVDTVLAASNSLVLRYYQYSGFEISRTDGVMLKVIGEVNTPGICLGLNKLNITTGNSDRVLTIGDSTGGIIQLPQMASGGTPASNSARIYSRDVGGTAEMFVKDEAGNETQISPHNTTAPESLVDSPFDEIGYTANYYLGIITYTNKQRQIAGRSDAQFFETFEEHNERTGANLTILDWDTVQADHVAKSVQEHEIWQTRKNEWEANTENTETPFAETEPEILTAKVIPEWLAAQLEGKEAFLASRYPAGKSWPSKAEFWSEFTESEKIAILTSQDIAIRMLDKELTMWTGIILATDSRIINGLDALQNAGILTEIRRESITTV